MTDLTEQWKKGKLEGFRWYYVKFKTGKIDICWLTEWSDDELGTGGQYFDGIEEETILEVIAPVPSYEEWKEKNEENAQLKELLEIAVKRIEFLKKKTGAPYYGNNTYLKTIYQMCDKTLRQIQELEK